MASLLEPGWLAAAGLAAGDITGRSVAGIVLPLVFTVALILALVWLAKRQYRGAKAKIQEQTAAMEAWAAAQGWAYEDERPDLLRRWRRASWPTGAKEAIKDYVSGHHRDRVVAACEYQFDDEFSEGIKATRFTVCALTLPMALPRLVLKPENALKGVRRVLGRGDIEVGWPQFDDAWRLTADDAAFAQAVVARPLQQVLVERSFPRQHLEIVGQDLLIWARGRPDPAVLEPLFDALIAVADAIPGWVWTAYGRSV
ncbi:MAG: hypothetical protein LBR27_09515 [Bifidobacteriaceae bacterium]|jgi:hypothetical protein|nr:hypothetical protein [Bifidobacteriaceae bacterium]